MGLKGKFLGFHGVARVNAPNMEPHRIRVGEPGLDTTYMVAASSSVFGWLKAGE
jgi:hypothetical protein